MIDNFCDLSKIDLNKLTKKELIEIIENLKKQKINVNNNISLNSLSTSDVNFNLYQTITDVKTEIQDNYKKDLEKLKSEASRISKYNQACDEFKKIDFDYNVLDAASKSMFSKKFDLFDNSKNTLTTIENNLRLQKKYTLKQKYFNEGFNKALNEIELEVPMRIYSKYISKIKRRASICEKED